MKNENFTTTILVDQSPEEVFTAVSNVRGWWSGLYSEEITGNTADLNEEFTFRAGGGAHYSKQKIVEAIPGKKIVWLVTESELSFLEKKDEWTGTKITFDISKKGDKTMLVFTHVGLIPEAPCYDSCAPAWSQYVERKLLPLISSGRYR
jgi:uncharacterized protein YndB with AHSA1/START domain